MRRTAWNPKSLKPGDLVIYFAENTMLRGEFVKFQGDTAWVRDIQKPSNAHGVELGGRGVDIRLLREDRDLISLPRRASASNSLRELEMRVARLEGNRGMGRRAYYGDDETDPSLWEPPLDAPTRSFQEDDEQWERQKEQAKFLVKRLYDHLQKFAVGLPLKRAPKDGVLVLNISKREFFKKLEEGYNFTGFKRMGTGQVYFPVLGLSSTERVFDVLEDGPSRIQISPPM